MNGPKEFTLPSGAVLQVNLAPFADSKALYQAVLEEVRGISINDDQDIGVNLIKDLFCTGFSSKKIEATLEKCLARCLYKGERITKDSFEDAEARGDYMKVLIEVTKENILPFVKSLSAEFSLAKALLQSDLGLRQKMNPS